MDISTQVRLDELILQVQRLAYAMERRAKDPRDNNVSCLRCRSTLVPPTAKNCPACGDVMPRGKGTNGSDP